MLVAIQAEPRCAPSLDSACARLVAGRRPESGAMEVHMLRIYDDVMEVVCALRSVLEQVGQHDADLARQMRRALTSVPLNVAEGASSRGRNRAARYHTGAGSMREVIAAIEVAAALGYVAAPDPALVDRMGLVVGTPMKNARK